MEPISVNEKEPILIYDSPLLVLPKLAEAVGLNESIVLQQVHYWLNQSNNVINGQKWVYNTMEEWGKQFSFWSLRTTKRTFANLEAMDILTTGIFNKDRRDRTKWYTIDYDVVRQKLSERETSAAIPPKLVDALCQNAESSGQNGTASGQNGLVDCAKSEGSHCAKSGWSHCDKSGGSNCANLAQTYTLYNIYRSLTETTTETTTENTTEKKIKSTSYSCRPVDDGHQTATRAKKVDYKMIVEAFNGICISLPRVMTLSEDRKKKIRTRLETFTEEQLIEAFHAAQDSDFMSGRDGKWSGCNFDWIMRSDNNVTKLLEGNYRNKRATNNAINAAQNLMMSGWADREG